MHIDIKNYSLPANSFLIPYYLIQILCLIEFHINYKVPLNLYNFQSEKKHNLLAQNQTILVLEQQF